jgi:hypothetical protein
MDHDPPRLLPPPFAVGAVLKDFLPKGYEITILLTS